MSTPEEISAKLNERLEGHLSRVQSATVPVYLESTPAPEHIGSGILIRIGDEHFMFTAAHVADFRSSGALYLGGESFPIRMFGTVTHTKPPHGDRLRDKVDAALIHLSEETTRHLQAHEFLSIGELDVASMPRHDDYYLVAGYPCTQQRFVSNTGMIEALLYPFVAVSKLEASYTDISLDPNHHILLGFSKKEMWRRDRGRVTAPDLYGISGGGIWWLPDYTGPHCDWPRLHALAIEWHVDSRRQVLGTRISVLLSAVWRDFPALRDLMP